MDSKSFRYAVNHRNHGSNNLVLDRRYLSHQVLKLVLCIILVLFLTGRIKTPAFSEFLYSATNIIVFLNDQILLHACQQSTTATDPLMPSILEKCHVFLTTLEYLEVFIEIAVTKVWGLQGKWIAISTVQIIK